MMYIVYCAVCRARSYHAFEKRREVTLLDILCLFEIRVATFMIFSLKSVFMIYILCNNGGVKKRHFPWSSIRLLFDSQMLQEKKLVATLVQEL